MFKVIVKQQYSEDTIFIYGKKSLLIELEERSILPNYNCRQGHCGICIAILKSGDVSKQKSLYPLNNNEILICQTKPLTDISIEIL